MGRKQFRTGEDGERIALASACVDCGSANVYGLDRCQAHYMREYRRRRTALVAAPDQSPKTETCTKPPTPESPEALKAPIPDKAPSARKPWSWQPASDQDFEPESTARKVALYLREL